jgi:C4-dicarboxylate-specific signal transduction histidine kinase
VKKGLENSKKLSLFSLFDNLSENEMDLISRETEVLHFEKGEVVCLEDTDSDSMYFIYDGEVSISQKGVSFATLKSGDYFGEMSLITGGKRNATVTPLEPSVLFEISASVFDRIFERSPRAMYNLLVTYDDRLRRHNEIVVDQFLKMKEQFEQLEDSHKRLLLSDKMASIGLLTAGIAHEINYPLFVITGYLDVMNEMLHEGNISIEEFGGIADKLGTASKAIVKLVSGIKTYARIDKTDPIPIDLNAAIQESLDLVSFLYRQDNIELKNGLSKGSPMILGNIGKLQQVLVNLLSNARDAMESSGTRIISVNTREENGKVVVEVADTGCGIAHENIEDVFSRAFTTKPVGKGSGMGLDLVRKIVEDMDGTIGVESQVSKGTTFRIIFPKYTI